MNWWCCKRSFEIEAIYKDADKVSGQQSSKSLGIQKLLENFVTKMTNNMSRFSNMCTGNVETKVVHLFPWKSLTRTGSVQRIHGFVRIFCEKHLTTFNFQNIHTEIWREDLTTVSTTTLHIRCYYINVVKM